MEYFHNTEKRTLSAIPSEPTVYEKKKRGDTDSWTVTTEWTITRADNYLLPNSHQWRYNVREHPHETYDAHRDSREQAIRWFKMNHHPAGYERIDFQTYNRLFDEYSTIIKANKNRMSA